MRYPPIVRRQGGFTLVELLTVLAILALLAALLFPVFARVRESSRGTSCLSNLKQIGAALTLYLQDYDETYPMSRFPDEGHALTGCTSSEFVAPKDGLEGSSVNWKRAVLLYVKNRAVYQCPSSAYAWRPTGYSPVPGDETNAYYTEAGRLPTSYAYNGSFFHEAIPACWYGERWERPRNMAEINQPTRLILLVESRFSFPDLGGWFIPLRGPGEGDEGPFQSHNGACNWLFADQHAKRLKLAATCRENHWTDQYVNRGRGCENLHLMAPEYR